MIYDVHIQTAPHRRPPREVVVRVAASRRDLAVEAVRTQLAEKRYDVAALATRVDVVTPVRQHAVSVSKLPPLTAPVNTGRPRAEREKVTLSCGHTFVRVARHTARSDRRPVICEACTLGWTLSPTSKPRRVRRKEG